MGCGCLFSASAPGGARPSGVASRNAGREAPPRPRGYDGASSFGYNGPLATTVLWPQRSFGHNGPSGYNGASSFRVIRTQRSDPGPIPVLSGNVVSTFTALCCRMRLIAIFSPGWYEPRM